jgi:hypothetical protein
VANEFLITPAWFRCRALMLRTSRSRRTTAHDVTDDPLLGSGFLAQQLLKTEP